MNDEVYPETNTVPTSRQMNFFGWLMMLGIIFAVLTAYLTQNIYVMNINIKLQKLEVSIKDILRKNELLEIDLAQHTRLETIDQQAVSNLKMIRPQIQQLNFLIIPKKEYKEL